jgi:hypothetical protein
MNTPLMSPTRRAACLSAISLLCAIGLGSAAKAETPAEQAFAQATSFGESMEALDAGKADELTAWPLIEQLSDNQPNAAGNFRSVRKGTWMQMREAGVKFDKFQLQAAHSSFTLDGKLFVFLPYSTAMRHPTGSAGIKSFFIGMSTDGGNKWTFLDAAMLINPQNGGINTSLANKVLPGYKGDFPPSAISNSP